jgi:hypothetical protein
VAELEGAREELWRRGVTQALPTKTVMSPFLTSGNKWYDNRGLMLLVMGKREEFTSVDQLEQMAKIMRGEEVNEWGRYCCHRDHAGCWPLQTGKTRLQQTCHVNGVGLAG